jgi:hypothetical protein
LRLILAAKRLIMGDVCHRMTSLETTHMGKRKSGLKADSTGQFYRQLGYKAGAKSQPKFRLGKDRARAELAYQKLGMLWDVVVKNYVPPRMHGNPPGCWVDHPAARRSTDWYTVDRSASRSVPTHACT